jgi:hypothetical protein
MPATSSVRGTSSPITSLVRLNAMQKKRKKLIKIAKNKWRRRSASKKNTSKRRRKSRSTNRKRRSPKSFSRMLTWTLKVMTTLMETLTRTRRKKLVVSSIR